MKMTPVYHTVEATGPDHARTFTVEVQLGDRVFGRGQGRNKQAAEQEAARAAILQVERELDTAAVEAQAALDALGEETANEPVAESSP
jgi:dsRNA-specific ribonuclease